MWQVLIDQLVREFKPVIEKEIIPFLKAELSKLQGEAREMLLKEITKVIEEIKSHER